MLVYFGQDGCPYCTKLMTSNFSQRAIVDKTRRHFVPIALNLWGDRDVKWIDGRAMSEKALGRVLDVQFTPTILILDEAGRVDRALERLLPAAAASRRCSTTPPASSRREPRSPSTCASR